MRELPPIAKAAERMLVDVEHAVRRFPRYHRYATGAVLRQQAAEVNRLVNRAWRDREQQEYWTGELVWAVDELRLTMQLGQQLRAFVSFAQFETLILQVENIGRQAGAWKRKQRHYPKGQNSPQVRPKRAQTLSARAASHGANA